MTKIENEILELIEKISESSINVRLNSVKKLATFAKDGKLDRKILHPLINALNDPEKNIRLTVSETLGWLAHKCGVRDEIMLDSALKMLNDDIAMLRHDGAWILESLAFNDVFDRNCIEPLLQNLSHKNNHVKAASAYALGTLSKQGIKDRRILNALNNLKDYNDKGVQDAIETALTNMIED